MKQHTKRQKIVLFGLLLLFFWSVRSICAVFPSAVPVDAGLEGAELPDSGPSAIGGPKLIALTFDDGPRRSTTTRLLDGLAERGVHATFFLIGCQIQDNRDLVLRMDQEGHQIGIHTFDHVRLTALNQADFDAQVGKTRTLLKQVLGHNDFLLRPPYGLLDDAVKTRAGCPIILWSIDPEDWDVKDTQREVKQIVSEAQDGAIILLHDIYPESVEAALQVVDQLHQQGYLFCTIDELFSARSIPLEAGEVYHNACP